MRAFQWCAEVRTPYQLVSIVRATMRICPSTPYSDVKLRVEIGDGGSIYIMEIGRCYKSGLSTLSSPHRPPGPGKPVVKY